MKKIIKNLGQWITIWLWIVIVIWISGIAYSALSSLEATDTETLTAAKWNALVEHAVPSWAVMAFNLATCPTGWIEANGSASSIDLRWTFIRWINWDANSRDVSRILWDYQADELKYHNHTLLIRQYDGLADQWISRSNYSGTPTDINTNSTWWTETRPKNIALLYCVKD